MKVVDPQDAPVQPTARRRYTQWRPVFEALDRGKTVILVRGEDFEPADEGKVRNAVSLSMKRWGIPVTIRKDQASGDLVVFRRDQEVDS